jgi:predicted dehydrogenase
LPAVQALDEVELTAIATTRRESAEAAREQFGARRGYANAEELLADPEVEAVTVAVRVPGHRDLAERALRAGKHVYCEWPLTADTASAAELQRLAEARGLETVIGLQTARSLPVRRAAGMVAAGELGELLSVTLECTHALGGASVPQDHRYLADDANGANLLTITAGHALDTLCAVAGEVAELSATLGSRFPEVTVAETGERIPATSPDQVSVTGQLENGAVMTACVLGGVGYDPGFKLEVRGTRGGIRLTARPGLSAGNLSVEHVSPAGERQAVAPLPAPPSLAAVPQGPPSLVAGLYLDLAEAIRYGKRNGPDFAYAVRRHRLLDAIRTSAAQGNRQQLTA